MAIIQGMGVYNRLALATRSIFNNGLAFNNEVVIYKGTAPADADTWTRPAYAADELAATTGYFVDVVPKPSNSDLLNPAFGRISYTNYGPPSPFTASATGTAAWFAMYETTDPTVVMIGSVSVSGGGSALQLDSLNIVSGNLVTILDFTFTFTA